MAGRVRARRQPDLDGIVLNFRWMRVSRALVSADEAPLPEWAQPGNFVFMGLSGGPLEAEKGLRSGWDGFTHDDPNGNVQAVRDFYRPENIEIPLTASANWVYVIWSNGWTRERDRAEQWPAAERFVRECRKHGIHVTGYLSAANMFWEDYLKRKPESRAWIETREPGFLRHYGDSPYRVMAKLSLPAWRSEIKASIDAALDAGLEGFWVDNLFPWHGEPLFADFLADLRSHAARRQRGLVWHINVNSGIYHWGRAGNVLGTEDGRAPTYDPGADPPIQGNQGVLSFISGLTEGWRSAELEHYGNNLSAETRQLQIAECWSRQVGCAWFPFDRSMRTSLHHRRPAAWKVLESMGAYYRHQLKHHEYFQRGEPVAAVGVIGYEGPPEALPGRRQAAYQQGHLVALLDYLAAWNIQFEVLFEDRLRAEVLDTFSLIVVAETDHMPPGAPQALESFALRGGRLLVPEGARLASSTALMNLPPAAFLVSRSPALLRDAIRKHISPPLVEVGHSPPILSRAVRQKQRVAVHLLNYAKRPVGPVPVRFHGAASRAEAIIPELGAAQALPLRSEGGRTTVTVPEFPIHALVAFWS